MCRPNAISKAIHQALSNACGKAKLGRSNQARQYNSGRRRAWRAGTTQNIKVLQSMAIVTATQLLSTDTNDFKMKTLLQACTQSKALNTKQIWLTVKPCLFSVVSGERVRISFWLVKCSTKPLPCQAPASRMIRQAARYYRWHKLMVLHWQSDYCS